MKITNIIFAQPFTVNAALAEKCTNEVIVLDLAFDGQNFERTTKPFINTLGDRLVMWVDHHDHQEWVNYQTNPRFLLAPRSQYAACPPMITDELLVQYEFGDTITIVCHGDFDGIVSAAKFTLGGQEPYAGADADSIAIDSRIGISSDLGKYIDECLKVNLQDNAIKMAVYQYLIGIEPEYRNGMEDQSSNSRDLEPIHKRYVAIQQRTKELTQGYRIDHNVAYLDAVDAGEYDLTQLLLAGQKLTQVAVVRQNQQGKTQYTIAAPNTWNFVEMFGLKGGMPNRVNIPVEHIDSNQLINVINMS